MKYQFESFELDTKLFEIRHHDIPLSVEPKVFDLIAYLIKHRERLISRDELFEQVWQGREVSDTSLSNHIKSARKLLNDTAENQRVIKTSRGRGYQFIAPTVEVSITAEKAATTPVQKHLYWLLVVTIVLLLMFAWLFRSNQPQQDHQEIKRIAVVPFANLKPTDGNDYLGFAIADQVIGQLMKVEHIQVRSSAAVQHLQQQTITPKETAEKLNVNYLVTGNYIYENQNIRLNIELIDIANEQLLWRESITQPFDNIFNIQEHAAQKVFQHFRVRFSPNTLSDQNGEKPQNQMAYNDYLRALSLPQTNDGATEAILLLEKAIALDSKYSPYYVELGNRAKFLAVFELKGYHQKNKAIDYFHHALALNPESRLASIALASSYIEIGQLAQASSILSQHLKKNRHDALAHFTLGYLYRYAGMLPESIRTIRKAINIEKNDYWSHNLGVSYLSVGEYEKALVEFSVGEQTAYSLGWRASAYIVMNKHQHALALLDKVIALEPDGFWALDSIANKSVITGETTQGLAALKRLEQANLADTEPLFYWAGLYAKLGDRESAIKLLSRSVDNGYYNYPYFMNNSYLDPIRASNEFQEILSKVHQKHQQLKLTLEHEHSN